MSTQRTYPFPYKTIPNIGKITCSGIDISNVSIIAVNPPPSEYTLTLPINAGAPGQVLQTDGTGILTWVNQTSNPGTVTSVSAAVPAFLSVSVSNPTTTPIINITYSGSALPISSGGTGLITVGANGTILRSNGSILQYGTTVDSVSTSVPGGFLFTANVTFPSTNPVITFAYSGTLPTSYGGTGLTSVGSNGQVLTSNGSSLFYSTPTVGTVTNFSATITPIWTSSFISATVTNSTTTPALNIDFTNVTGNNALVLSDRPIFENWITVSGTGIGPVLGRFGDTNATPGSFLEIILGKDVTSIFDSGKIQFYYEGANDSFICFSHRNKRLRWYGAQSAGALLSSTAELTIDSPTSIRFTVQKTNPSPPPTTLTRTLLFTGDADFTFPTSTGTNGYPLLTNGSGVTSWSTLGTNAGGTGLTSVGTAGQVLTSNGTTLFWQTNPLGTVTSVSASVPSWLSVTVTNPTTTPFISITGTATGTGTVTVLQQDPTINGTLTLTDKMYIDRNSGSGQAIRIFNAHSTFPVDNYISIGHNSNALNHGHFGHHMVANNSALNYLYWENNGNRMRMDTTGNVGINTAPFTKFHVHGAPSSFGIQYLSSSATLSTVANSYDLIQRWYESTGNGSYIDLGWIRTSTGGAWTTAGQRFQSLVDTTYMGYIQFGGTNNNSGLTFGTGTGATPQGVPEQVYINSSGNMGIGGHGAMRFGVGEGAFDGARYGTIQITTSDTIISSTNNISQISFVRNGNYVHGLGYKQNSSAFGFGQGVTANFQPSFLCIDPGSGRVGIYNINPEYTFDVSSTNTAFRNGYGAGLLIGWNAVAPGSGATDFWNYRGGGGGGFKFKNRDTSNNDVGWSYIECGSGWFNGQIDINSNGEVLRLRGTDHAFTRYVINGINRAYTGFPGAGNQTFHVLNEYPTGGFSHLIWGNSTADLMRVYTDNNTGYGSCNWATPAWNVSVGVGGGAEPSGLFRNKYYIYQNGPALVIDTTTYTGLGITSPTQQLDVNGNIRTRASFTSNNVNFFTYASGTFAPRIAMFYTNDNQVYECNAAPVGRDNIAIAYSVQLGYWVRTGNMLMLNMEVAYSQTYAGIFFNMGQLNIVCVVPEAICKVLQLVAVGMTGCPTRIGDRFVDNYQLNYYFSNPAYSGGGTICTAFLFRNNTHDPLPWDPTNKSGQRLNITTCYYVNQ